MSLIHVMMFSLILANAYEETSDAPENQLNLDESSSVSSSESSLPAKDDNIINHGRFIGLEIVNNIYGDSNARNVYISDFTGYKFMITRQLAAISLHALVSEYFSFHELMGFVNHKKVSVWSKFLEKVRPIIPSQKQQIKSNIFFWNLKIR